MEGKGRWYGCNWSLSPSGARRPAGTATVFISWSSRHGSAVSCLHDIRELWMRRWNETWWVAFKDELRRKDSGWGTLSAQWAAKKLQSPLETFHRSNVTKCYLDGLLHHLFWVSGQFSTIIIRSTVSTRCGRGSPRRGLAPWLLCLTAVTSRPSNAKVARAWTAGWFPHVPLHGRLVCT